MEIGRAPGKHPLILGKILYGFLFVIALPLLLLVWAWRTEGSVRLPSFESFPVGLIIAFLGAAVMVSGMLAIYIYGEGLPMNAYPPVRFVHRGIFRFLSHPIYTGFSILCVGIATASGSSSGLWLVSTVVSLGCVALVQGFERHDLRRRFGFHIPDPLLRLPANASAAPRLAERLSVYILALFPWLLMREAVRVLGQPADAAVLSLPFEENLPVFQWAVCVYAGGYLFILLTPLIAATGRDLRSFAISGLLSAGILMVLFMALPYPALLRPFSPQGLSGQLLDWERLHSPRAAAMLSSYIAWAVLAAKVWASRMRSLGLLWFGFALLVPVSGIACGNDSMVDLLAGLGIAGVAVRARWIWDQTRQVTEKIANSWREWRWGPIRVINHGFYAGTGAFAGLLVVGTMIGPGHITAVLIVTASVIVTSALWAQQIEGSPSLLRPYGWYGGMLGAIFGVVLITMLGEEPWQLLAAFSVAGPWAQSAGRLRCLVQGCCHGREAPAGVGISYSHPRSRVVSLAGLAGIPIHPTPLYSILWNAVVAVIVARLWLLHAHASMIVGVYLILGGLGRFVEESYRGEPQTRIYTGLRLYQWLAIVSVLTGIFTTMITNTPTVPGPEFNWGSVIAAGGCAVVAWFGLGVDFPESSRRFARLA